MTTLFLSNSKLSCALILRLSRVVILVTVVVLLSAVVAILCFGIGKYIFCNFIKEVSTIFFHLNPVGHITPN